MGMYLCVHVGPILKLTGPLEKTTTYVEKICSGKNAPQCTYHREGGRKVEGNFCSNCGSSTVDVTKSKIEEFSFYDITYEMGDAYRDDLYAPEYLPSPKNEEWIIPNRNYYKYDSENFCLMGNDLHIEEDLVGFNKEFEVLLSKLRDTLGEDKVKVDWGIVNYYS